jgi:hypothetical protein
MSTTVAYREDVDVAGDSDRRATARGELPPETLRPLLEGARARGLADALELIGVPAVLIDGAGAVLNVGAAATARMGPCVGVASRHLVGADPACNQALQDLIAAALAGKEKTAELRVSGAAGGLCVRAIPMPDGWANPYQLLKAVIVFDDVRKAIDG